MVYYESLSLAPASPTSSVHEQQPLKKQIQPPQTQKQTQIQQPTPTQKPPRSKLNELGLTGTQMATRRIRLKMMEDKRNGLYRRKSSAKKASSKKSTNVAGKEGVRQGWNDDMLIGGGKLSKDILFRKRSLEVKRGFRQSEINSKNSTAALALDSGGSRREGRFGTSKQRTVYEDTERRMREHLNDKNYKVIASKKNEIAIQAQPKERELNEYVVKCDRSDGVIVKYYKTIKSSSRGRSDERDTTTRGTSPNFDFTLLLPDPSAEQEKRSSVRNQGRRVDDYDVGRGYVYGRGYYDDHVSEEEDDDDSDSGSDSEFFENHAYKQSAQSPHCAYAGGGGGGEGFHVREKVGFSRQEALEEKVDELLRQQLKLQQQQQQQSIAKHKHKPPVLVSSKTTLGKHRNDSHLSKQEKLNNLSRMLANLKVIEDGIRDNLQNKSKMSHVNDDPSLLIDEIGDEDENNEYNEDTYESESESDSDSSDDESIPHTQHHQEAALDTTLPLHVQNKLLRYTLDYKRNRELYDLDVTLNNPNSSEGGMNQWELIEILSRDIIDDFITGVCLEFEEGVVSEAEVILKRI